LTSTLICEKYVTPFLQVSCVILCDKFNTPSKHIMLGHESDEKVVLPVSGMMLQGILNLPAFQFMQ
jgi:hypothetical protein